MGVRRHPLLGLFYHQWENTSDLKTAERLNGIVYMPPPVAVYHDIPHSDPLPWLSLSRAAAPGVVVADNSTLQLTPANDAQPGAMMFVLPEYGGRAHLTEGGYVAGVPELVAEAAASSASYDLNLKLDAYRRRRIPEYVAWQTYDRIINWFTLHRGRYVRRKLDRAGVYRSKVSPACGSTRPP
jgi:hypothetical protein